VVLLVDRILARERSIASGIRTCALRPVKQAHPSDPTGLGVLPHVADAVLGHKDPSPGTRIYTGDLASYLLSEKREALATWGTWVLEAVAQ
jgi:hypothetical protein